MPNPWLKLGHGPAVAGNQFLFCLKYLLDRRRDEYYLLYSNKSILKKRINQLLVWLRNLGRFSWWALFRYLREQEDTHWRYRNSHVYLENNQWPNVVTRNESGRSSLSVDIVILPVMILSFGFNFGAYQKTILQRQCLQLPQELARR